MGINFQQVKAALSGMPALALNVCPLVEEKEMAFIRFPGGWGTKALAPNCSLKVFVEVT